MCLFAHIILIKASTISTKPLDAALPSWQLFPHPAIHQSWLDHRTGAVVQSNWSPRNSTCFWMTFQFLQALSFTIRELTSYRLSGSLFITDCTVETSHGSELLFLSLISVFVRQESSGFNSGHQDQCRTPSTCPTLSILCISFVYTG